MTAWEVKADRGSLEYLTCPDIGAVSVKSALVTTHPHSPLAANTRVVAIPSWQPRKIQSWSSMRSVSSGHMCTASANGYSQSERDILRVGRG